MRMTLLRSLAFAVAVLLVSLAGDLLVTVWVQGMPMHGWGRQFIVFRIALHGATFVFVAIGAMAGFALLRSHSMAISRVAFLGAAAGLFALAAVRTAVNTGSFKVITIALLVVSALICFLGGKVLGSAKARQGPHALQRQPD